MLKFDIKKNSGITIISLVVTILVLLILAGISINIMAGNNGILSKTQNAKITKELSEYVEKLEIYKTEKLGDDKKFLTDSLTAGKNNLFYNTKSQDEIGNIKTVIPTMSDEYLDSFEIIKGELLLNTKNKNLITLAQNLGIQVNPYDIEEGTLLSSTGNLLLMDNAGTLTIPDSITSIGEGAFSKMDGLKSIIIPGSVKQIQKNAFAYNTTLEKVILEEGVEKIGGYAFLGCSNLRQIELPESLTTIEGGAFQSSGLQNVKIPSGVTRITSYAFAFCSKLVEIDLPLNLSSFEAGSLRGTGISEIFIPSKVTQISGNAFAGCTKLSDIDVSTNDKFVYEQGMLMPADKSDVLYVSDAHLKSSATFTIPEGLVKFSSSISNYTNITKLILPESLENITASELPTSINSIEVNPKNIKYKSENNLLYENDSKKIIMCYSKDKDITIQEGILELGEYSFKSAVNAQNINLPDSLKIIRSRCI